MIFAICISFAPSSLFSQEEEWSSRGAGGGGAFFSPAISPHDGNILYVATDMSGVFNSKNFGKSWLTLPFSQLQGGINSHVRFTSNPDILYAINLADDKRVPMRSTDGGKTWKRLSGFSEWDEAWYLFADPSSTSKVMLCNYNDLFFSSNSGKSLKQIHSESDLLLAGVFWSGNRIFAATPSKLLVSNNGGSSFSKEDYSGIPSGETIVSMAGANSGSDIVLFAVTLSSPDAYPGVTGSEMGYFQGVYRYTLSSGKWQKVNNNIPGTAKPFFVAMAANDANTVYLAGGNSDTYFPVILKSTNSGNSWSQVFKTESNANIRTGWCGRRGDHDWWYPEYALGFAVSPTDKNRLILSDLGTVHVSSNGGTTWQQAYVATSSDNKPGKNTPKGKSYQGIGLENTSSWSMLFTGNTIIAGLSDISGLISNDSGKTWMLGEAAGLSLNTTYCLAQKGNTIYGATSSVHDIYQSHILTDSAIDSGTGGIVYSSNKGKSWNTLHDFNNPVYWLAIDPSDTNCMYASVVNSSNGGIYRTTELNKGTAASWTRLPQPSGTQGHPANINVLKDGGLVATFSARRDASGSFTPSSGIFYSSNRGQSWTKRSSSAMNYWTKELVVDPHDPSQNTWYACVFSHWGASNNNAGGLYKSSDRGRNWKRIFVIPRAESLTISPTNRNIAWLTTENSGLWKSTNFNNAKPVFKLVEGYPFKHPTRIFYHPDNGDIWITSFGGGLYTSSSSNSAPVAPSQLEAKLKSKRIRFSWADNSVNEEGFYLEMRQGKNGNWERVKKIKSNKEKSGINRPVTAGTYYFRIYAYNSQGSSKASNKLKIKIN
jgi:photosystem II stability/assembly factor-like uncharacterized protein